MNKNNKVELYPAYDGNDPYMFVSYAHRDAAIVFPELRNFQDQGYNVWYDEGIAPGNEWPEEIANALENSSLFVVFITPNSAVSKNVKNEIYHALHLKIPFIAIHLQETYLEGGLALSLQYMQAILKYNMSEEEYDLKCTKFFKSQGFFTSDSNSKSYAVKRNVKSIDDNSIIKIILLKLLFWKKDDGNYRIALTKLFSILGFIAIFLIFIIESSFMDTLMLAALVGIVLFVIGFIIHIILEFLKKHIMK